MKRILLRDCMFHANDAAEHTLCYSPLGWYWRIENPEEGEVATFDCFRTAMNYFLRYSDPQQWSISDNPYI